MSKYFKSLIGKIPENLWKAIIGMVSVTVLGWLTWIWDGEYHARIAAALAAVKDYVAGLISTSNILAATLSAFAIFACIIIYYKQRELNRYRKCERMFEKAAVDYADTDYKIFRHLFIDVGELLSHNGRVISALRISNEIRALQRIGGSALETIEDSIVSSLNYAAEIIGAHCANRCSVTIKMYTGQYGEYTEPSGSMKKVRTIRTAYADKASSRKLDRNLIQREDETPFDEIANHAREYYMRTDLRSSDYRDSDRDSGTYNSILVIPIHSLPDKTSIVGFIQADSVDGDIANESSRHYLAETAWRAAVMLVRVRVLESERIRLHQIASLPPSIREQGA